MQKQDLYQDYSGLHLQFPVKYSMLTGVDLVLINSEIVIFELKDYFVTPEECDLIIHLPGQIPYHYKVMLQVHL